MATLMRYEVWIMHPFFARPHPSHFSTLLLILSAQNFSSLLFFITSFPFFFLLPSFIFVLLYPYLFFILLFHPFLQPSSIASLIFLFPLILKCYLLFLAMFQSLYLPSVLLYPPPPPILPRVSTFAHGLWTHHRVLRMFMIPDTNAYAQEALSL